MELNKGKCQGNWTIGNNPRHQYTLVTSWLESSSAEKDLGVLVDSKTTMRCNVPSWQRKPTTSLHEQKHCQRVKGGDLCPTAQPWWDHIWSTVSSAGLLSRRETWTCWRDSMKWLWRWLSSWRILRQGEAERAGAVNPLQKRRLRRILSKWMNLDGENKEDGARLLGGFFEQWTEVVTVQQLSQDLLYKHC